MNSHADDSKLPPLKLSSAETQQKSAAKSAKLIEELASEAAASVDSTGLIVPEHSVRLKEADSRHPVRVGVKVTLPGVKSVGEVDLEISKVSQCLYTMRASKTTPPSVEVSPSILIYLPF